MAYYRKINTDLRLKLFTDLILENHPDFCEGSNLRESLQKNPAFFNIEHIVETMFVICSEGQYEFDDSPHQDFTDESDSKTGTLHTNGGSSAEITGVRSNDGVLKKGALRCVILNPILNKLHFIFIPKDAVNKFMHTKHGKRKKTKSVWLRYNKKLNSFRAPIDKYGCVEYNTFKELAMEKNR